MTEFHVAIPSRFASTRLPGKPLADIHGKPMVQHVYERAARSGAHSVTVATDDSRIVDVVKGFGGKVVLTRSDHVSGTDRLQEVASVLGLSDEAILVNVQGDEPLIPQVIVRQVAQNLSDNSECALSTLCEQIESAEALHNPNVVKVIMTPSGRALYFSRAVIPWARDAFAQSPGTLPQGPMGWYRHIGLYAYRVGFLNQFVEWGECPLEKTESLEQLRALWNNKFIHVALAQVSPGAGVDTQEDLEAVRRVMAGSGGV
jgi:3-deoxy-manno-octulosonate cytidylyltransferase (CMP-KDO synthetase)